MRTWIPERQCTRGDYDGQALSPADLRLLEQAGTSPGVRLLLLTERQAMEKALEYVVAGNTAQMRDEAFVRELKAWIRFSQAEAVRAGEGLFSGASGNPNVPRWMGRALMGLFFTVESENDRYARPVRNASGVAVFIAQQADPAHWVDVGRCCERFARERLGAVDARISLGVAYDGPVPKEGRRGSLARFVVPSPRTPSFTLADSVHI